MTGGENSAIVSWAYSGKVQELKRSWIFFCFMEDHISAVRQPKACPENGKDLEEEIVKHDEFNVSPVHEYIIMLAKAGYELDDSLNRSIKKFFGMEIPCDKIAQFVEELKTDKFIEGNKIAEKGNELIESKKFKAYIRVLKERRLKDGSE